MDIMLILITVCTAVTAYIFSGILIWYGAKTSFWSWFLWGILDAIAMIPTVKAGDNPTVLIIYTVGSLAVAVVAYIKGQRSFGWVEYCAVGLAVICFICAQVFVPSIAILFSTASVMLVGLPLLWHVYQKRTRYIDTYIVILFLVAVIASDLLARGLGDETIFLDASCVFTVVWLLITEYSRHKPKPVAIVE